MNYSFIITCIRYIFDCKLYYLKEIKSAISLGTRKQIRGKGKKKRTNYGINPADIKICTEVHKSVTSKIFKLHKALKYYMCYKIRRHGFKLLVQKYERGCKLALLSCMEAASGKILLLSRSILGIEEDLL